MIVYKLFRCRKTGTLGSLFINRRAVLPRFVWLTAQDHETRGFKHRPGWHCTAQPQAPHLSSAGRQWFEVEISDFEELKRPALQGGTWFLAKRIKILNPVKSHEKRNKKI